jgi:hypothetical protein
MADMATVELFKLIVLLGHSSSAFRFWMEHFHYGSAERSPDLEEFQRERLEECSDMFRWLSVLRCNHETHAAEGDEIYRNIISEVTCGYKQDARYREARLGRT